MSNNFNSHRKEYTRGMLSEDQVHPCPWTQFQNWFDEASRVVAGEPNACALGTVSSNGEPSVRYVLLKGMVDGGFIFFSHYDSRKGNELSKNNKAALTFYWPELERQVRLEGSISKISKEESDEYFASRPRSAQLGATVSKQSRILSSRQELDSAIADVMAKMADQPIQRPEHWGGYSLQPVRYEFWQGREDRLHDRLQYILTADDAWTLERLWP
jgi:pyridoxamine 5'-phosphate oxidase